MIDFAEAIQEWVDAGDVDAPSEGAPAPETWEAWVRALFPAYVEHPMTERHRELWDHVWGIDLHASPDPFVACWPRGGGKTTSAEMACTSLGCRGARRYAWYVSETQDKADKNVENVAVQLESRSVAKYYPEHASRKVSKYGTSRGWRRNRLRTAGGFTIDAVGLDSAARGLKVDEQRPDLIILDDIDGKHDTLATTAKKIATITTSVLPAGSSNCAILFLQNLIIRDGVMTRIVESRADFLSRRRLSGPHPAIEEFDFRWVENPDGTRTPEITRGRATWAGQSLEVCQRTIERIGPIAFLKELQHKVKELAEGVVLKEFDSLANMQDWTDLSIRLAIANKTLVPFAGIDYGLWRFAFLLLATDRAGRVHVLDEYFSQRETLGVRAKAITAMLDKYGITQIKVYGDPANPTDSLEMNSALEKGWTSGEQEVRPQWRAHAAVKDKGSRLTGPDRINELYRARALLVRRDIGRGQRWWLGKNASSPGSEQVGSRFLWEQENWSYANPLEGRAQDQDPDDDTADGADQMSAFRYAILSHLTPPKYRKPEPKRNPNFDYTLDRVAQEVARRHGMVPR